MPSPEPAVVAQLHPKAAVLSCIITTTKNGMLDEFVACNKSPVDDRIRFMMITPGNTGCEFYIFHDVKVKGDSTFSGDFKDWIPQGTVMKVYSLNGTIDFTVFTHTM